MTRTYRGPIIERKVERAIVDDSEMTDTHILYSYALAVEDGTGEIVIVFGRRNRWLMSSGNPHRCFESAGRWTVTP